MKLLTRYLVRQNLFLLSAILLAGTSIYLLTDIFERMDNILETKLSVGYVVLYFLAKLPLIISQILPAVFLLSLVAQFNILTRTREMVALQAGGISPLVLVRFVLIYGLIWSGVQLVFSQVLGVEGDRMASSLWLKLSDKDKKKTIQGLWFTEKGYIIHLALAYPEEGRGEGFRAYKLSPDNLTIEEMVKAERFTVGNREWHLENVSRVTPDNFSTQYMDRYDMGIRQNLEAFKLFENNKKFFDLSLWNLSKYIKQLQRAGSNVEMLRTVWHSKIAYAASLVVMGMLALIITQYTGNIYKAVVVAILLTFIFYTLSTFTRSMGEKGILNPMLAAWIGDLIFFAVCMVWFAWRFIFKGRLAAPRKAAAAG